MAVHLIKVCVGIAAPAELQAWQGRKLREARARRQPPRLEHWTRHMPRRSAEVLAGGSLYWVIRGIVMVRQRILGLEQRVGDDRLYCAIQLDPELVAIAPETRAPFQGWRYLEPADAPPDLPELDSGPPPPEMLVALRSLGLL